MKISRKLCFASVLTALAGLAFAAEPSVVVVDKSLNAEIVAVQSLQAVEAVDLQRMLDHYEIPYVLHRPQAGNWADKRPLFEKVTGWKGNSNPDTRSAAYFGFLALKN